MIPNRRCLLVLLAAAAVNFGTGAAAAPAPAAQPAAEPQMPRMEKLYLVLLRRSANAPKLDPAALDALQEKHLGHLRAMHAAGKLAVAGPLDEQKDQTLRGVCLYRVGSLAEARSLAEDDPMVKAGRLEVEAMVWWVQKGAIAFPAFEAAPAQAGKGGRD